MQKFDYQRKLFLLSLPEIIAMIVVFLVLVFGAYFVFLPINYYARWKEVNFVKEIVTKDIRWTQKQAVDHGKAYLIHFRTSPENIYTSYPAEVDVNLKEKIVSLSKIGYPSCNITDASFNGIPILRFNDWGLARDRWNRQLIAEGEIVLSSGGIVRKIVIPTYSLPFEIIPKRS